jgi:hypothetical protein
MKNKDKRLLLPGDEFAEEASEGLGRLSRDEAGEDLRELKERLERRVSRPRRIWLPAAAAVVTVLVASAVVISIFREKGTTGSEVALTETEIKDTALIAMAEPIQKQEKSYGAAEKKPGGELIIRTKGTEPVRQVAGVQTAKAPAGVETDALRREAAAAVAEEDTEAVMKMVVAEDEVTVPEEVVVEALPMMQKADMAEGEAAKKKSVDKAMARPTAATTERPASPVGGWEVFNDWIRPNISLPGEVKPMVTGVVVVAFKVRADSTLYDLKALRSGGDSLTQEAFRLLREGPGWVPAMRDGQVVEEEVRISIIFK